MLFLKNKIKASLLHLLISIAVVGSFIAFTTLVWYPSPFLEISGLGSIILILVTVDLILGPALTCTLYKPNKKGLKFDLSMIAAVQLAALVYGMHTIYIAHPIYTVYVTDRFTLMTPSDVDPNAVTHPELKVSGWWKPEMVYAQKPKDPKVTEQILFDVLAGKPDIDARPQYYEPFMPHAQDVLAHSLQPNTLQRDTNNKTKLEQFLEAHGKTANDYAYLPLVGKENDVVWVWSRAPFQPVGILDINPWKVGETTQTAKNP